MRLDYKEHFPCGMEDYLSYYGWHFNKKLCDFAIDRMRRTDGERISPYTKEALHSLMTKYGITCKNAQGYDCVYVANMAKADYYGSSISDEQHLVRFIKDYIDDSDGYEGLPMTRFYADCIGKGICLCWEDFID